MSQSNSINCSSWILYQERQVTRMLGDWEESKRLIMKHPFNGMIVKSMSSSTVNITVLQMSLYYMFEDSCCDTVKQPMFTSQRGTRSYAIINALDITKNIALKIRKLLKGIDIKPT
ncbi:hypothetical protein DBV15_09401 [Temnothorax longispinosus]|uniref:Uncharacterized protein n=1 Tax=Temnothorax longispinosus TaxID=300112 RepID=A0A4S2L4S4_9HYME|nr:hypothetical protein DBV15_09401 [Temnothorax longispinosus]